MVINAKSQIVIPKNIRDKFGIRPGQEVEFQEQQGKIVLVKKGVKEKFRSLAGKYRFQMPKGIKTTGEFLREVRGV
jgi:AbrB family looped-hinge helix DNA binding protein